MHDVAGAEAGGEQRARRAPEILALPFRLEDRPRRHQQAPHLPGAVTLKPPNGGCAFCSAARSDLRSTGSFASAAREVTAFGSTPASASAQPGARHGAAQRIGPASRVANMRRARASSGIAGFEWRRNELVGHRRVERYASQRLRRR